MLSTLNPESKPEFDIISSIFQDLKSDEFSTRTRSSVELRDYVVARVSKTPADLDNSTTTFLDDSGINQRIFDLIHSRNVSENLGGLAGIDHLLDTNSPNLLTNSPNLLPKRMNGSNLNPTADAEDARDSSDNLTQVLQLELLASQTLGRILHLGNNPVPIPNSNSELEDSHVPETRQKPKPIFTEQLLDFQISYHSNELVRFLNLGLAPGPDHLSGSTTSSIDILHYYAYYASLLVLTQLLQYMYRDKDADADTPVRRNLRLVENALIRHTSSSLRDTRDGDGDRSDGPNRVGGPMYLMVNEAADRLWDCLRDWSASPMVVGGAKEEEEGAKEEERN